MRRYVSIGVLILIIIIAIALIPFIDGYLFKQQFMDLIAKANQRSPVKAVFTVAEYHLGWFSSDAKVIVRSPQVSVPTQTTFPGAIAITMQEHISHGPFVTDPVTGKSTYARASISTQVFLPEPLNSMLFGQAQTPILQINSLAKSDDSFLSQIYTPPLNAKAADGSSVSFQGITGTSDVKTANNIITSMDSNVNIGTVSISSLNPQGSASMQPIAIAYNVKRNSVNLWDGNYSFDMPGVSFNSADLGNYSLKDFKITDAFGIESNQFYNNQMHLSLGNLITPDITVNSGDIMLKIDKLNAQGLANFLTWAYTIQTTPSGNTQLQMSQYNDYLVHVFTPTTALSEAATVTTGFGNFSSTGQMTWHGDLKTVDDIKNNAEFKVDLRVSISLVNKLIELTSPAADLEGQSAVETTAQTANTPPTDLDGLQKQIDAWATQNLITTSVGIQLKDIVKSKVASDVFAANVDQFVLRKDVPSTLASQLKVEYTSIVDKGKKPVPGKPGMPPVAAPQPVVVQAAPPAPPAQPTSQAAMKKQQIQDFLKQGYIKQDNDDYVTTITRENGVIKINGLNFPSS